MAIVMVLAGIAVSGLSDSTQNARQSSREIVKTHLQQARAHAIAKRNHTALIIPVRESGKSGLRTMSLTEVEKIDGRYVPLDNENGDTRLVQRWTALSKNFHFVTNTMIESDQPTAVDHENTISIQQRGNEIDCHMIVFAPNGQIVYPSSRAPIHIAIAQVSRNRNTFRITEICDQKPAFDLLLVNRLTAKTRIILP
ncbi:MAG: hypothetical protein V4727_08410 [Verrucomicrobiota bacterium]